MDLIQVMPIDFCVGDIKTTVFPTVIQSGKELMLVDCGYHDAVPQLERQFSLAGLSLKQLTKVFITHHDHDHMGALNELQQKFSALEALCSPQQAPYITGEKRSLRLRQAEALQDQLPDDQKKDGLAFQAYLASIKPAKSVSIVRHGDILPLCDGIEVIDTSGHMPGHLSLYIKKLRTLIAGDALVIENDKLRMASPQYILNKTDAQNAIKHLQTYAIKTLICYHGGIMEGDVNYALKDLVDTF